MAFLGQMLMGRAVLLVTFKLSAEFEIHPFVNVLLLAFFLIKMSDNSQSVTMFLIVPIQMSTLEFVNYQQYLRYTKDLVEYHSSF